MSHGPLTLFVFSMCLGLASAQAEDALTAFTLRDHLNRRWQHELVVYPLPGALVGRKDLVLLGPDGQQVAYQVVPAAAAPSGKDSIAFCASVPARGESLYRLTPGKPDFRTDLSVTEADGMVTVDSGRTAVRLGGAEAVRHGPIAGVRLPSGRWVGGGELKSAAAPARCTVKSLVSGPVFADVLVEYQLPAPHAWRLRFRLIAGEPVILVDETFSLPEGSSHVLDLGKNWQPDEMFYRDIYNRCQLDKVAEVPGAHLFRLEAWPGWWEEPRRGHWVSFCQSTGDDLLAIGCREPGVWVDPQKTTWATATAVDKQFRIPMQLRGFERQWMLTVLLKSEAVSRKDLGRLATPLAQQYLIQHDDLRLDMLKDWVLEWDDAATPYPHLYVTDADRQRLRGAFKPDLKKMVVLRNAVPTFWSMEDHIACFLSSGDEEVGRRIAEGAMKMTQESVDLFAVQDTLRNQGSCPHHRNVSVIGAAVLSDLALSPGLLKPAERTRLKAQLAYLAYTLERPTVISPERGYSANPNMTTTARGMLGMVACTIPSHPHARRWAQLAEGEIKKELEHWCDANGGWLEAPHYATVSLDPLISLAMALSNARLSDTDWLYHPKLKLVVAWLAKISTPPDPRLGGKRHMPEIGNSYLGEPTCLPGWMAKIWRDRDPQYARHMQWAWKAQGSPRTPGIGGAYPGFQGYSMLIFDEGITAEPPRWGSELFPQAGAVFRAHFPGERETWMHYIQGKLHQHYDYDEGSFIVWGKGQPLCEDFGYYGRAPAADHSRVEDGVWEHLGNEGQIREFATGEGAEYLRGERIGWHRQILFVKDADPLGPNYFLVRDSLPDDRLGTWRVWMATDEAPPVDANPVRAKGLFEADLAVFFAEPARPAAATERVTRLAGASGYGHDKRHRTQRALVVKMAKGQPLAAAIYPLMKDQPTPRMTSLEGGRVVKIQSDFGTDYAMLGLEPFQFRADGIEFDGKAGAVQIRPGGIRLSLPTKGKLALGGKSIEHAGSPDRTVSRQFSP